jgi:hypothetical protein
MKKKCVKDIDGRIECIIEFRVRSQTKKLGEVLIGTAVSHEYS